MICKLFVFDIDRRVNGGKFKKKIKIKDIANNKSRLLSFQSVPISPRLHIHARY